MNVTEMQMLERMQQMAANLAASLPQMNQSTEVPRAEKGESFQDVMNKAQEQKVQEPKKADSPKQVEKPKAAQKTEKTETAKVPVKTDGRQVELTAEEAAMLAAGYAKLLPREDGTVWLVTVRDESGNLVLPLKALEDDNYAFSGMIVDDEAQWTMEPTPEVVQALEQLLKETNDPRPADVILGKLAFHKDGTPLEKAMQVVVTAPENREMKAENLPELRSRIVVSTPESNQAEDEDLSDLSGEMTDGVPLFRDVKAAPVKVGENFTLDTQEPDMEDQLADTIRTVAMQNLRQVEIKLSPENLGSLTIKLTQASDGTLQVVLHASNPKAASLLTQHLDGLSTVLQGYGQSQVHVEVQRGDDSQQAQQQQQQTDPNGHNRQQQQQQQHRQDNGRSEDFIQRLRLGLFSLEDVV